MSTNKIDASNIDLMWIIDQHHLYLSFNDSAMLLPSKISFLFRLYFYSMWSIRYYSFSDSSLFYLPSFFMYWSLPYASIDCLEVCAESLFFLQNLVRLFTMLSWIFLFLFSLLIGKLDLSSILVTNGGKAFSLSAISLLRLELLFIRL